MSKLKFVKAHACGNDFLVIEESAPEWRLGSQHAALARKLCARNTGIGADGIEFLERRADGTLFLRLFNADGSEAELSGNGTRCVAAWLAESEGIEEVALGTHGGLRRCKLVLKERETPYWIESAMGVPRVMPRRIEVAGVPGAIDGAMVNVGNPHYVIFVENEDFGAYGLSWQELGAKIAVDPLFRFGTNVEFVRVLSADEIAFRIYERGCGPTTSSGTGTCASSAASMELRGVARKLSAIAEGGGQGVEWPDSQSEMMLTGPAEIICVGEAEVNLRSSSSPVLRRGSRVAVVSPASAARAELVAAGCERLRAFGYEPVVMPHALAHGPLYYAGTAAERVGDLHAAFADESIEGILCTRGGWGSAELLPRLDAELVRANPKVFVGYSDHTSLQVWSWRECGLRTFYAPMVAADWSKADGVDEVSWRAAVEGADVWRVGPADGLRVLRSGSAEGRLLGGCLSILEAGLGTPWGLRLEEPCVLFVEDIGVKPYQWDRMLQHLRFAGVMEQVRGVVFGDMGACVEEREMGLLEAACLHGLRDFAGPVAMGLRCGHVDGGNRSVPLGAWSKMVDGELAEA